MPIDSVVRAMTLTKLVSIEENITSVHVSVGLQLVPPFLQHQKRQVMDSRLYSVMKNRNLSKRSIQCENAALNVH